MSILSAVQVPWGLNLVNRQTVRVRAKGTAFLAGELAAFDLAALLATTLDAGVDGSVFATAITPDTDRGFGFGICTTDIAQNEDGLILVRGRIRAYGFNSIGGVAKKQTLTASIGTRRMNGGSAAARTALGEALEATSASAISAATAERIEIIFNGIEGLGGKN